MTKKQRLLELSDMNIEEDFTFSNMEPDEDTWDYHKAKRNTPARLWINDCYNENLVTN